MFLLRNERARTDKTHGSVKNIEELRQLVKACLAQEAAASRYAGVGLTQSGGRGIPRPVLHGSKLSYHESTVIVADPLLPKQHGASVINKNYKAHHKHER